MPARSTNTHPPASFLPVDLAGRRLVGATVKLCREIRRWERYPYTERAFAAALDAGLEINRAVKSYDPRMKVKHLQDAERHLDDLLYLVEVAVTAELVTPEQKAVWDDGNDEVRRQVANLRNSQQSRIKPTSSEAEFGGAADGATSNKKDAPSH